MDVQSADSRLLTERPGEDPANPKCAPLVLLATAVALLVIGNTLGSLAILGYTGSIASFVVGNVVGVALMLAAVYLYKRREPAPEETVELSFERRLERPAPGEMTGSPSIVKLLPSEENEERNIPQIQLKAEEFSISGKVVQARDMKVEGPFKDNSGRKYYKADITHSKAKDIFYEKETFMVGEVVEVPNQIEIDDKLYSRGSLGGSIQRLENESVLYCYFYEVEQS